MKFCVEIVLVYIEEVKKKWWAWRLFLQNTCMEKQLLN